MYAKYLSSSEEDFLSFHSMCIRKPMIPPDGVNFDSRVIIWKIFIEIHYIMSRAKYLSSSPCGFGENYYPYYVYKENQWSPQGGVNFDPRAKIWTTFVEVHQTMFHVKYLSSSLYGLSFSFSCHGNHSSAWNW